MLTAQNNRDTGVRLRDADNDGRCELIVGNPKQNAVFGWSETEQAWKKLAYALPAGTSIVDAEGRDSGLRFVDVNEDGYADVLFSNEQSYSLHQFVSKANPRLSWAVGWTDEVVAGKRDGSSPIPMIVRGGAIRNNGVWFHSHHLWVQNEDTAALPNVVDRRSFKQLLTADQSKATREEYLTYLRAIVREFDLKINTYEPVTGIEKKGDGFFCALENCTITNITSRKYILNSFKRA